MTAATRSRGIICSLLSSRDKRAKNSFYNYLFTSNYSNILYQIKEKNPEKNSTIKEKIKTSGHKLGKEFKKSISTAIIAAFSLIVALAWKDVITGYVARFSHSLDKRRNDNCLTITLFLLLES
jgi:hypothetical protein